MTDIEGVWFCIGYALLLAATITITLWAMNRRIEKAHKAVPELIYYGRSGRTAWAFTTPEELSTWAAEHPEGTFDVQVRER